MKFLAKTLHRLAELKHPRDYNAIHAARASELLNLKGKKCLVVGCSTGKDCIYFINYGAKEVHGLDVAEDIGTDFKHPLVKYFKMSVEKMKGIKDNTYDLVYSLATMEHVRRIGPAFKEMVRVTKPGGFVYSLAAPLWNSRHGYHVSQYFESYPWIHLRLTRKQIRKYCQKNHIKDPVNKRSTKELVDYMLSPLNFNKNPAHTYIQVCNNLKNIEIITNQVELDLKGKKYLTKPILDELTPKGYTPEELLGVVHTFIAKKCKDKHGKK